jgi:hypothetical protein
MAAAGVEALIRTASGAPAAQAPPETAGAAAAPDVNGTTKPGVPAA